MTTETLTLSPETTAPRPRSPEPARARPVFSTEDKDLLKEAVLAYIRANEDAPNAIKYTHLYHRLGRMG